MTRTSLTLAVAGALVWGCSPGPEPVFIDLSQVRVPEASDGRLVASQPKGPWPTEGRGSLVAKEGERLYDDNAARLHALAVRELLASRERAVLRFVQILEAQVAGSLAVQERQGMEEIKALDAKAWSDTRDQIRTLFESYAGKRGDALLQLSGEVGIPDKGAKPPGSPANPFRPRQLARVAALRESIARMDAAFDSESAELLAAYTAGRERLRSSFDESVRRRASEERAALEAKARQSVAVALETVNETFPVLDRSLDALNASVVASTPPARHEPAIGANVSAPALTGLQESAKLFAKARGYRLGTSTRGARDVTEEFQQWVTRQRAGLSAR